MPSDGKAKVTHIERLPGDVSTLTLSALSEGFFGGQSLARTWTRSYPMVEPAVSLYDWSEDGNTVMCIKMKKAGCLCRKLARGAPERPKGRSSRLLGRQATLADYVTRRESSDGENRDDPAARSRLAEPEVRMSCATEKNGGVFRQPAKGRARTVNPS